MSPDYFDMAQEDLLSHYGTDDEEYYHDELERDHDESYEHEPWEDDDMDGDHDSAMESAGHGTDEDYGYFGADDYGDY